MKTQHTGWKLKLKKLLRKSTNRQRWKKKRRWSRKYNTQIIGVLGRKTGANGEKLSADERIQQLLSTTDKHRRTGKSLRNLEDLGKRKTLQVLGRKGKKKRSGIKHQRSESFGLLMATPGDSVQGKGTFQNTKEETPQHDSCATGLEESPGQRKMEVSRRDVTKETSRTNRLLV